MNKLRFPKRAPWWQMEITLAWLCGLLWATPLLYAFWAAFHSPEFATSFTVGGWTFENIRRVWEAAPFGRYYLNTAFVTAGILVGQIILGTLLAYAVAKIPFRGSTAVFYLALLQLMIVPDVLISENYVTMAKLGLVDNLIGIGLPYLVSGFAIFLLRQAFKSVPIELDEAAEIEGCSRLELLWKVYVPLARPTYIAFALVSFSHNWNNFLWPLVVSNSEESRLLTVGLAMFAAEEAGVDWTMLSAAAVLVIAPLLIGFLLFQRQFVNSFMRTGIR